MTTATDSKPIPVRLKAPESSFLVDAKSSTGISQAELIRRVIRYAREEAEKKKSYAFLLDLAA